MTEAKGTIVANCLKANKAKVLALWEQRARQNIPAAGNKSTPALRDALPIFLDNLIGALSPLDPRDANSERKVSKEHGEQRACFGDYSLSEVITEYTLLQKTLLEVLEVELGSSLQVSERDVVLECVAEGLRQAAAEFSQRELDILRLSNQSLEHFAKMASHDLQEPLRMISSYLALIERKLSGTLDEKAKSYFTYAIDGARRMKFLIDSLLEYSTLSQDRTEGQGTDLNEILANVLANLQLVIRDTKASVTVKPLPSLTVRPSEIMRLFQNLINNAIKFRGDKPPKIEISATEKGTFWEFCVTDDGIGISPENRERIFSLFQRVHARSQYPGAGLGLAISKRVVDLHGGSIWVDANPQGGCLFKFTLPNS